MHFRWSTTKFQIATSMISFYFSQLFTIILYSTTLVYFSSHKGSYFAIWPIKLLIYVIPVHSFCNYFLVPFLNSSSFLISPIRSPVLYCIPFSLFPSPLTLPQLLYLLQIMQSNVKICSLDLWMREKVCMCSLASQTLVISFSVVISVLLFICKVQDFTFLIYNDSIVYLFLEGHLGYFYFLVTLIKNQWT